MPSVDQNGCTRFFVPIVQALKEKGGSGTTAEVIDRSIEFLGLSEDEQQEVLASGGSKVRNQAQWARLYLVKGGILDSSARGIWSLTDQGKTVDCEQFNFVEMFRETQRILAAERRERARNEGVGADDTNGVDELEEVSDQSRDYRSATLAVLRDLPSDGFERLCQRLLRESGFEQVEVTGRSGDGGIDGVGILQINPFVSFNILFQCKRYLGSVSPSQIRDFRGAMQGRADKGIILTTGTFTVEAKREARRDGAPPIELVDGDALVRLFEKLEFGLIPRTTFDVDARFFCSI